MSKRPLEGCGVLVTRPLEQAADLQAAIDEAGGRAFLFPVLEIIGREPAAVAAEFAALPKPDILIFVSRNAVRFGAAHTIKSGAEIAAVGPATRAAAEAIGATVSIFPESGYDSEHLLNHPRLKDVRARNVTIVRGEHGRQKLGDELRTRGAKVSYLSAYRRQMRRAPDAEVSELDNLWRRGGVNCVTVLSVETLQNLLQILLPTSVAMLARTPLVAPGSRVIQTALDRVPGLQAVTAESAATDDIVNALIETWNADNSNG